jgi:hypothetical protein
MPSFVPPFAEPIAVVSAAPCTSGTILSSLNFLIASSCFVFDFPTKQKTGGAAIYSRGLAKNVRGIFPDDFGLG